MADKVRTVGYYAVTVDDKPGEGAKILGRLKEAGVNLLAFHAFPTGGGKSQLDFVPADEGKFQAAIKTGGWNVGARKDVLLVQGDDRVGAVAEVLGKLASAKINATATSAACGPGGYGLLLWVKPEDVARAGKALGG